jgi:hypothetical protein
MVVFVESSCHQWRRWWDGGTMTQWQPWQWHLLPMVVAVMAVIVVNCAMAVDAAAAIPSSASMAAAKMRSQPLPSTIASINDDCYCRHQRPPLLLAYS